MIRTLSSDATFVNKLLLPPIWLAVMGWMIISSPLPWLFGVLFGLPIAALGYALVSLKRVRVGPGALLVSNYRVEVAVPLADIEQVIEPGLTRPRMVTLRLRQESRLGESITFIPADQAAVDEIRALIAAAHDRAGTGEAAG